MAGSELARIRREIDQNGFFDALDDDARDALARGASIWKFERGGTLFRNGTLGSHLFVVLRGRLKIVSAGPRGNELVLGIVEPGDVTGFVAAVDGGDRFVTATALGGGEAIAIGRKVLMEQVDSNPAALRVIIALLAENLRVAASLAQVIGLLDARARLWSGLMRIAPRYGRPTSRRGAIRIDHGLSQEDLAATVGITRVAVNRTLGAWRAAGLVQTGRGFVEILDPEGLAAHVREEG